MLSKRYAAVLVGLVVTFSGAYAWGEAPALTLATASPDLDGTIARGISLLESEHTYEAIEFLMSPSELGNALETRSKKDILDRFKDGRASELLGYLKILKKMTPKLLAGGKKAIFSEKPEVGLKIEMVFFRVGDRWYLRN
jgi:hypothetical protein